MRFSSNDPFTGLGRFFILLLSEFEPIRAGVNQTDASLVRSATIPDDVRSRVRIPLGILPGDRFVFLDWDLWVSSCKIIDFETQSASLAISSNLLRHHGNEGDEFVQRHYFVPDDWAMGGSLDLCCITVDGILIYPRDDKLSIIKATLNRPAFRRGSSAL